MKRFSNGRLNGRLLFAAWVFLTAFLVALLPVGPARQIPAFLLLWPAPAFSWAMWGFKGPGNFLERFLIGAGFALLSNSLLALLISYLPGSPSGWLFLGAVFLSALGPIAVSKLRQKPQIISPPPLIKDPRISSAKSITWLFIAVMALALLLRLVNLDYKELQGDEGIIMVRAAAILTGDENQLFLHQKGPVEILLPLITWGMTGATNDFWARLPFTWAGWLGVGLVFVLGRRWFSDKTALTAALLFAICGFGIAFSRIIQYQTLVMLWSGLSLLTAVRFRQRGRPQDLMLTAVFLAAGLLAHYDAVLVIPAVLWLLFFRFRQEGLIEWPKWLVAVLLCGIILGIFYLPFVLNPNFERTFLYLLQGRVVTDERGLPFNWSGAAVWQMITYYNSLWYVLGLIILVSLGLWRQIILRRNLAPILYFLVPTLFYTFVVGDPRTHVYTLFPGAVILAGIGLERLAEYRLVSRPGWKLTANCLFAGWLLLSTLYVILIFVDVSPERQRTWSENRPFPSLYPWTWDAPPEFGLFGFPHQAGWRAVADFLNPAGLPYASNEEEEITNYYTRQAQRTHCRDFETFLLVKNAQDEIPYEPEWLSGYFLEGQIVVAGQVTMEIYGREEKVKTAVESADSSLLWLTPQQVRPPLYRGQIPVEVNLADQVILAGYEIDSTSIEAGERLVVLLYWEVLAPFENNKQVFVHLADGQIVAQDDSAPECAVNPTTRWEPGQIIVDPHIIQIPADTPPGSLQLVVGLYDLIESDRLQRLDGKGDNIYLTDVLVR